MGNQKLIFQSLKEIKDYVIEDSIQMLKGKAHFVDPECEKEYELLATLINTPETQKAYKKVLNEMVKGIMHSTLVMIDGGGALDFRINLVNSETMEVLNENIALHEEFFGYLLDVEDNES